MNNRDYRDICDTIMANEVAGLFPGAIEDMLGGYNGPGFSTIKMLTLGMLICCTFNKKGRDIKSLMKMTRYSKEDFLAALNTANANGFTGSIKPISEVVSNLAKNDFFAYMTDIRNLITVTFAEEILFNLAAVRNTNKETNAIRDDGTEDIWKVPSMIRPETRFSNDTEEAHESSDDNAVADKPKRKTVKAEKENKDTASISQELDIKDDEPLEYEVENAKDILLSESLDDDLFSEEEDSIDLSGFESDDEETVSGQQDTDPFLEEKMDFDFGDDFDGSNQDDTGSDDNVPEDDMNIDLDGLDIEDNDDMTEDDFTDPGSVLDDDDILSGF